MSIATLLKGMYRGTTDERTLETTHGGALVTTLGLPPYTELARQSMMWQVVQVDATACLVVRPTTVAAITLWNGEGTGGKSYVIDRIFTHCLVATAGTEFGLWACVHPAGMVKPTADIGASATNITGTTGKAYTGNGMVVVDVGATVGNNGWYPYGMQGHVTTITTPGGNIEADIGGRLIVPPQGGISLQVVGSHTSNTFTSGVSWIEVDLDLV